MANFNPNEHLITLERRAKKRNAQGQEYWEKTETKYLPVQARLLWFREVNPAGKLHAKPITIDYAQGFACFECYAEKEDGGSSTMHGSETREDWKDFVEKAETKATGRALAALGYGTQFSDRDFDEGERIVDTPVERRSAPAAQSSTQNTPQPASTPAPVAQQQTPATSQAKATEQQLASIKKLHEHLKKPLPANLATLTYEAAKQQISTLTAEYRQHQQRKAS